MKNLLNLFNLLFCLLCLSCSPSSKRYQPIEIYTAQHETITLNVEYAISEAEKTRGLSKREHVTEGTGMLFIYSQNKIMSFWMKDTLVGLSIAFISADGYIHEIHDMHPHDTMSVVSNAPMRYALEVPIGWFSKNNIAVGDKIAHASLKKIATLQNK